MNITFYSTHCPKCKVLEKLMKEKNISYSLVDSEDIVLKVAEENNILSMPFADIDGQIFNTKQLQNFINERG